MLKWERNAWMLCIWKRNGSLLQQGSDLKWCSLRTHAWERVFNFKGIGLCSIFTVFHAYEPESERKNWRKWEKLEQRMWMFCFAIKEFLDSSKTKHLQIYHSKCEMVFLIQEKFRESKWPGWRLCTEMLSLFVSCHIKQISYSYRNSFLIFTHKAIILVLILEKVSTGCFVHTQNGTLAGWSDLRRF